ncbi:cytidylate kinase Cmk [Gottschalkia acidurici 9a]|uniref:Cytidylate kinase n=1 Tax=Gottschalkia acidurici (strain ATCC 7906 / DSM 604 / BCRC 14475 / CIP 104303 / KCTC 5404 / NCIMB 10678 / 9a) TaxID=1128398 RepID=K0AYW8_GOTA9|nr:(d)CMP kinase [Gottschalkia acidurici]AFS78444.1 cytidylate kinase Cmk [Gottschalkia acidurici 9a]
MKNISIAIDGPAGAGKSTIAKIIAKKLNIDYIDTGAMYRAFTLKLIKNNIDLEDFKTISSVLNDTSIDFSDNHIYLDGLVVDDEIRNNQISNKVSIVAKIKEVRERLVQLQKDIAKNKDIIMDGRDIGTSVLPNSKYKFFLNASVEERALRRFNELKANSDTVELETIKKEIEKRDEIDKTREISPLIKSHDAIEIDTTNKSIDDVVDTILSIIKKDN